MECTTKILEFGEQQKALASLLAASDRSLSPSEGEWNHRRKSLITILKRHGKARRFEIDEGDFFVGDDWFDTNCLRIVDHTWKIISELAIRDVQRFLSGGGLPYVATIARSFPAELSELEILVTRDLVCSTIYGKSVMGIGQTLSDRDLRFLIPQQREPPMP